MVGRAPRDHCDSWLDADEDLMHASDMNIRGIERAMIAHEGRADNPLYSRSTASSVVPRIPNLVGTGVIGKSTKGKTRGFRSGLRSRAKNFWSHRRGRYGVSISDVFPAVMLLVLGVAGVAGIAWYVIDTISMTSRVTDTIKSGSPTTAIADPFNWAPILIIGAVVLGAAALAGLAYVWRAHLGPRSRATAAAALAAKADAREAKTSWSKALVDEAGATARWLAYEKDLALAMEFPMMRDFSHPLVREVVTAMGEAAALRGGRPTVQPGREAAQQPYVAAVRRFTTALDVAQAQAERVREHLLTPEQQSNLKTARQLFRTVTDDAASVHERQVALRRMTTLLQGVLVIPEQTMSEIEHRYVRLVLASTPNAEKVPA